MQKIALFFLIFFATSSQTLLASEVYSPDSLIEMALKTHPNMKMYEEIVKGAQAQTKGAKWNYFPTPSASAYSTQNGRYGTTLAIEQPLWTGGKIDAAYDMAVGQEKEAQYMSHENSYMLVDAVIYSMQSYLQFKESAIALQQGRDELKKLEAMLNRRIQAGVSPRSDMNLLQSRLSQIEIDLNLAKTKEMTSLSQLALLTGRSYSSGLVIDDSNLPYHSGSLEEYFTRMEETHPILKKISAQTEVALAEKKKAKAVFWPNISLRAEQQIGTSGAFDKVKSNDSSVFVSIQASPGAGLSGLAGVEQTEARIMQLEYEKVSKKQDLMDAMMHAFNDYHSTSDRINPQQSTINSSKKVMESYTRLFLAGKKQWLDLVNASRELTNNKMAFAELKATRLASAYRLALLRGDIVKDNQPSTTTVSNQSDNFSTENFVPSLQEALVQSGGEVMQNEIVGASSGLTNVDLPKQDNVAMKKEQTNQISVSDIFMPIDSNGEVGGYVDGTNDTLLSDQHQIIENEKQESRYFIQLEALRNKTTNLDANGGAVERINNYPNTTLTSQLDAKEIAYEVVEIDNLVKLWAGPYATRQEASNYLQIIKKDITKDAFIVTKN